MAIPTVDSELATWSVQFQSLGSATPLDFGLTAAQMTQYTTLHDAYIAAYNAANADGAKSKAVVQAKETAKENLLFLARELYSFVQANNAVTDENKVLIGVVVKDDEPTPQQAPAQSPLVTIVSVTGRTARCRLADRQFPTTKRRPVTAKGATILSYVGPVAPPEGDPGWKLEGQTGKTEFLVQFPNDVEPGTPCWVTALWYNQRGEYSPACPPVQTFLQIGPQQEVA